ncbi:hypothetical protein ACQCN2_12075 [Brevibacillus ginsengisoli]|uniref:hypothetical protein n=1 Tax=Brevibacillus ginsengisoli TaxID=363854 RepID=UPI003CF93A18
MKYPNKTERVFVINAAGSSAKTFVLWPEVVMSYVSPAIMAGIGGLITADRNLQIAALTTIGGSSALVAWMLGLWLRSRGRRKRWLIATPHLVVVGMFALAGVLLGLLAAWMTSGLVDIIDPAHHLSWVDRVWTDFPLSATIACTMVTWHWRQTVTTKFPFNGGDTK